jgi:hypothetical protein
MNQDDGIDGFIERSSLGAPAVKMVRSRTPATLADVIVTCAERCARIFESDPTYQAREVTMAGMNGPERKRR